ncbi:MAG: DsbA family protein [Anaerolineales bacterium]|nr:MAG: DsbA family protein [Anaerolineales bacterium]
MATTQRPRKQAATSRKIPQSPTERRSGDDILRFEIKRSHFWALVAPLTFVLGLAVGFVLWGRGPVATANNPAPTGALTQTQSQPNPGNNLADIQRYEITIDDNDPVFGPADAPITIVEFADFQCPYCVRHFEQTYPLILEQYGEQVRFVFKNYPLRSIHPDADAAAQAAECAQEQGMFWEYHDLLFGGALGLGREAYAGYADQLGLDTDALLACLDEGRYAESVERDYALGQQLGVSSTPTFFINGIAMVGAYPIDAFQTVIDFELGNSGQ